MNNSRKISDVIFKNKVVILFVLLCIGATAASKQPLTFVATELFTRIARNAFIVLALIIPVIAGMGLNFGIVIGAMAAQVAIFLTTYWGLTGVGGFFATVALTTPIAVFFGFLVGKLFNQMKGNEMIGGLVLGYFAEGFYQLLFLFIFGGVITMDNPTLMIATGVGVKNTIDLSGTVKYALDTIPMLTIIEVGFYLVVLGIVASALFKIAKKQPVVLAVASGLALDHGGQNRIGGVDAGRKIRNNRASTHRPGFLRTGDGIDAAGSLSDRVKGGFQRIRASLSVSGDRCHDNAGIDFFQVLIADPHLLDCAGAVVLNHDIGLFD